MGVLCAWVKLLIDLQILGCELHKNAFSDRRAIVLPRPHSRYKGREGEKGKERVENREGRKGEGRAWARMGEWYPRTYWGEIFVKILHFVGAFWL